MEKRGRGRPKKITTPNNNLIDFHDRGEKTTVKCDGNVSYSDNLPEFYKFYVPALLSERLKIPHDFVVKFGENIPATVTLRGASGISQQASMNKINDYWFLEKGWPEFVKENSVKKGDFMTFSYAENATFYVKVFAVNGCRKRVDILQQSEVSEPVNNRADGRKSSPREQLPIQSMLKNRSFSVVLTKAYVRKRWMYLPMEFWREYVEKNGRGSRKRKVTLWVKTKSWNVCLLQDKTRFVFSQGWGKFVVDNSIQSGSLCTFKLIDSSDTLAFDVIVTLASH